MNVELKSISSADLALVLEMMDEFYRDQQMRFSADVARKALEIAHRQVFYRVSAYSLEELSEEVEIYLKSSRECPLEVLRAWQNLEPYRIAVPMEVNPAVARLFLSNIRLALAIFRHRQQPLPPRP